MSAGASAPTLGVIFHPTFAPETLPEYARRAEAAGFDELWLWDDCFLPGALTAAAIALAATQRVKLGIGLLPATVYHPVFVAMELTTLARAFPQRILPGFGFGIGAWMTQIGAAPKSFMTALEETVVAVRQLLSGAVVTTRGEQVRLETVRMQLTPAYVPPLYIGAQREKSLQLAGRIGDGTILPAMSSPAYIRWAWEQIRAGMAEAGRSHHRLVVYRDVKVHPDGAKTRDAVRRSLVTRLPWSTAHLNALGIADDVAALLEAQGSDGVARHMPDAWVDAFAAAGTPDQVADAIQHLLAAGTHSVVFQPLDGDPACLDEYIDYLMPRLKRTDESLGQDRG